MGKKLTNNWGLKLIAILFALILWFAVINIDDPVVSVTFKNVPVQLVNTEVLTDAGLTYEILDDTTIVDNITVYGPRTVVESLKEDDIVAQADINDITVANTVNISVSIDSKNSSKITNIRTSADCVKLNIEEAKTKQFVISATPTGKLASGYIVGGIELDQNRITISGPTSIVSQVASAKVSVDVTDANSDVVTYGIVQLLDKEGNQIESSLLTKSAEKVHISVDVVPTKYVPVRYEITGKTAGGYTVVNEDVTCSIMTVLIAGELEDLRNVDEIFISGDELDVSGESESKEVTISLKNYLPEGVILGDKEFDGKATIKIPIEEVVSEVVEIARENISIINAPENYQVKMQDVPEYTEMEVTGAVSLVRKIMINTVTAEIDMNKVKEQLGVSEWVSGTYSVEADLNVSASVSHTTLKIIIEISDKE